MGAVGADDGEGVGADDGEDVGAGVGPIQIGIWSLFPGPSEPSLRSLKLKSRRPFPLLIVSMHPYHRSDEVRSPS